MPIIIMVAFNHQKEKEKLPVSAEIIN